MSLQGAPLAWSLVVSKCLGILLWCGRTSWRQECSTPLVDSRRSWHDGIWNTTVWGLVWAGCWVKWPQRRRHFLTNNNCNLLFDLTHNNTQQLPINIMSKDVQKNNREEAGYTKYCTSWEQKLMITVSTCLSSIQVENFFFFLSPWVTQSSFLYNRKIIKCNNNLEKPISICIRPQSNIQPPTIPVSSE